MKSLYLKEAVLRRLRKMHHLQPGVDSCHNAIHEKATGSMPAYTKANLLGSSCLWAALDQADGMLYYLFDSTTAKLGMSVFDSQSGFSLQNVTDRKCDG